LAHYFRRFSTWLLCPIHLSRTSWWYKHAEDEEVVYLMVDRNRKQREGQRYIQLRTSYSPQRHAPHLLSPARYHLLKFSEPSKIVPPTEDQAFNA
jgi:hypothetical protein